MNEQKILEILNDLPHGSGIDCKWSYNTFDNGNVTFFNSYHVMNECGYYDGWENFSVRVFRHKKTIINRLKGPSEGSVQVLHKEGDLDWRLCFTSSFKNRGSRYGLRDYLVQVIEPVMSEHDIGLFANEHMLVKTAKHLYPNAEWRG